MSDEPWGYKVTAVFYVFLSQAAAERVAEDIESKIGGSAVELVGTKVEPVYEEPKEQGA